MFTTWRWLSWSRTTPRRWPCSPSCCRPSATPCCSPRPGASAWSWPPPADPDVILLDLGLPDLTGTTVIARLREWTETPIVVVSGSKQVRRKADALDAGADDFIDKPFDISELRARLDVVQRRLDAAQERSTSRDFDGLSVDYTRRQVHRDGEEVRLTETEWLILEGLSRDAGRIVTHRWLSTRVWGPACRGRDPPVPARAREVAAGQARRRRQGPAPHPHRDRARLPLGELADPVVAGR